MVPKRSRLNNRGYIQGSFGYQQYSFHRLICAAFHGEPPSISSQARHLNGNKLDNRPANLKWGSVLDNQLRDGKASNKLDPGKVLEIRKQLMAGVPRPVLQRHHDISAQLMHCLAYNKIWKLGDAIPPGFEAWQALHLMPVVARTEEPDYEAVAS